MNSTEAALKTWYPVDHPLHLDPKHPVIALAGEAGELLDLLKKDLFKPNFSWWRCKVCRFLPVDKAKSPVDYFALSCMNGKEHTPLILDELGDYSYYLRILCHQIDVSFEELANRAYGYESYEIEKLLVYLNSTSSEIAFQTIVQNWRVYESDLQDVTHLFMAILRCLDTPLEKVLEMNYQKLNGEASNHGWKGA